MANLEKIMAETSKSYDNSRKALNDQIGAISSDLAAQQQRINAQYAQQGKNLDNQRNWQAQASSMSASRNGGSFGGSAEIANKKYYQQAYVPAVTQMQTNQANDLSSAESQANQNRLSLQQTLAQLNDEANRYALQRYDAAKEAEREDAYRKQQMALQRLTATLLKLKLSRRLTRTHGTARTLTHSSRTPRQARALRSVHSLKAWAQVATPTFLTSLRKYSIETLLTRLIASWVHSRTRSTLA